MGGWAAGPRSARRIAGELHGRRSFVVSCRNRTSDVKLKQERERYAERLEAEVATLTRDTE